MENTPTLVLYITAFAAIAGALFSGAALFIQKKISWQRSVEQVAVFRQKWISELRDTMAEFQGIATAPNNSPHLQKDFYRLGTKIELLLNTKDEDYQTLHNLLYRYLDASLENHDELGSEAKLTKPFEINAEFVKVCQRILKREWDRLKNDLKAQKI